VLFSFGLLVSLGQTSASLDKVKKAVSDGEISPLASVSCDTLGFANPFNFAVGDNPVSITSADFDGDGIKDLAVPSANDNSVSLFSGDGTAGFSPLATVPVGTMPVFIAAGDIDGDSLADFVTADQSSNTVTIVTQGDGFLTNTVSVGNTPTSVAIGDFNKDGIKDFAVTNFADNNVSILTPGEGIQQTTFSTATNPQMVVVGDFNKDGNQDLAVACQAGNAVTILIGGGDGDFATSIINLGTAVFSLAIGDFNQDGNQDLATSNINAGTISILSGNGAGGFTNTTTLTVGTQNVSVMVGDFNLDSRQDIIVTRNVNDLVKVFFGAGNGTFPTSLDITLVASPVSVVVDDFNGDNKPDFATANQNVDSASVFFNTFSSRCITPSFAAPTNFSNGMVSLGNAVGDLNRDGKQDVVTLNGSSNNLSVFLGTSSGSFGAPITVSSGGFNPNAAVIADFNKDAIPDLAVSNRFSDAIAILLGDGTGNFVVGGSFPTGGINPSSLAVIDFDLDGNPDVVTGNVNGGGSVSVFFGNGTTLFPSPTVFPVGASPSVTAGDFDQNGIPDFIVAIGGNNTLQVFFGGFSEGFDFSPGNPFSSGGTSPAIQDIADFNEDGNLDILITNFSSQTGNIFLGDGVGNFNPGLTIPSAQRLRFADFNSDGNLDIFAGSDVGTNLRIFLSDGQGANSSTTALPFIFGNSFTLALSDFNRDGRLDLGSITFGSTTPFSLRLSNCVGSPSSILATSGSGQTAALNTAFANPLRATVFDPNGQAINGVMVQFDTPTAFTSAGATFPGNATTANATTNTSGIATSPTVTANGFVGSYMALASVLNDSGARICTNPGYSLTNICPTITLAPVGFPTGTINVPYNQTVTASGGTAPYSFTVSLGNLPTGLTLSTAGVLSGTPTQIGMFNFTITATDANGCTGMQSYTLTISCAAISFSPATLPAGLVGSPYDQTITVNGVATPITVNLLPNNNLPPGLSLISFVTANSFKIAGTPSTPGTFNFTLQVTDTNKCIATQTYSIVINCANITLSPSTLANGQEGLQYSQTITAIGGRAPYAFSRVSGNLPPGLNLLASGALTGSPTVAGTYNFTVQARDLNSCTGSRSYTVVITGGSGTLGFSVGSLSVSEGGAVTVSVARTGGTNGTVSVNYGTNNGSAVAGRDFSSASGILNFVSGSSAPQSFTIQTIANNSFEPNKTFSVNLFSVSGGATLGASSLTITVLEKDVAQPGRLAFSQSAFSVSEAGGVASIIVVRTGGSNVPVSVNFSTSAGANAQAGTNYFEVSDTLTFAPGSTSRSINIPIINDRQPGQDKIVNLILTSATNGAVISSGTATLTIVESTPPPAPAVLQGDARVEFGNVNIGDMARRTVMLRNVGAQDLTFTPPVVTGAGLAISSPAPINRLAPNQSTSFEVTLKPAPGSLGSVSGNIVVNSNGGNLAIPIFGQSIDNLPPSVTFKDLTGGDILTAGSSILINYDASDNDALNDFTASFVASQNSTISPQATGASGGDIARLDSTSRQVRWFIPADLETSNARVIIRARDRAGNIVTVPSGQFSVRRSSNRAPILQTVLNFTPPVEGITPPTNLTANATEIRDEAVNQAPEPALIVQITFDPPPANQLLPPQNVKVKAGELIGNIANVSKITPKAEGDLVIAGYNVYRVPQPKDGSMPPVDQIVNPNNLVTSLPPNATMFTDKVSTSNSGSGNFTYSVSTFFGNGQMSSGSQPMGTNLPVIINPMFSQGTVFLESAGSFIKQGATLTINDTDTYNLQFDETGTRFTVSKRQASSSGSTIKRLIGKTSVVKLIVKNSDGTTSVGVMFSRKGIVKTLAQNAKENLNIEPKADTPAIAGYNIYRVPQPTDGTILSPEEIIKPENLIGSISGNMTTFTDKVSTSSSGSGNFTYSVSTFFGNGQMSSGSQPASTDLPVLKNPKFEGKNFFIDSAGSFIKPGTTLIINDTEMYILEFDDTGTRFTPGRKMGSPSNQTIDKFIKKGDTVRLTIKNSDGKLSVGVMFTRN
jgi:hypothetical protein